MLQVWGYTTPLHPPQRLITKTDTCAVASKNTVLYLYIGFTVRQSWVYLLFHHLLQMTCTDFKYCGLKLPHLECKDVAELSGWVLMYLGFPGSTSGKEPAGQCRRHKRCGFDPWVGEIPWRRTWQPPPVFLSRESNGQRSLAGYSPYGHKKLDMTEVTLACTHIFMYLGFFEPGSNSCSLSSHCVIKGMFPNLPGLSFPHP